MEEEDLREIRENEVTFNGDPKSNLGALIFRYRMLFFFLMSASIHVTQTMNEGKENDKKAHKFI